MDFELKKLIPKYRQLSVVGLVIDIQDNFAVLMQKPDSIERVYFPETSITSFLKVKRRIVVIANVINNGRGFFCKKLTSMKVLKIQNDDWWRIGRSFGIEVCPRISFPSEFHPRWPFPSDDEGRVQFSQAHTALRVFFDRVEFHQKSDYKNAGFTKLDRLILNKKIKPARIDIDKINSNPLLTPPQMESPRKCPKLPKKRTITTMRPNQLKPKLLWQQKKDTEIIDLSVISSDEESDEEPNEDDLEFLDDSQQDDGLQIGASVEFSAIEIKSFHENLYEMIGDLGNNLKFEIRSKHLSMRQFIQILSTARPVDKIDLNSLVKSIPTNTFQMAPERADKLFAALLKANFCYTKL